MVVRLVILLLCALWVLELGGCAHPTQRRSMGETPSEEVRGSLGRIGVVLPAAAPNTEIRSPAKGALGGAGRGAALGAYYTIVGFGAAGGGYGVMLGLLLSPVGALVGTVYGAASAESVAIVEEQEASARQALEAFNAPGVLRRLTFEGACRQTRYLLVLPEEEGSAVRHCPATSEPTTGAPWDTSLRVVVERVDLVGPWTIRPKVALSIGARTVLSRVADGQELDVREFSFMSELHETDQWTADDNRLLLQELERGCATLAGDIVERLFLLYPIP
jgi:hypothetical protein